MFRIVFFALINLCICLFACTGNTPSATAADATHPPQDSVLAEPDAADLLETLQGKWQSTQDSTYVIEFAGTKMRHYNGGKISVEAVIEIDGNCLSTACKVDSMEIDNGWCFVEKGQMDAQCNLVLKCTKQELQYQALGAANAALIFRKQ